MPYQRDFPDHPVAPLEDLLFPDDYLVYDPAAVASRATAAWYYTLGLWTLNAHRLFAARQPAYYPEGLSMLEHAALNVRLPTNGIGGTDPGATTTYEIRVWAGHHRHVDVYFAPTSSAQMQAAQSSLQGITGLSLNGVVPSGGLDARGLTKHYLWWYWAGLIARKLSDALFRALHGDIFLPRVNFVGLSAGGPLALFTAMQLPWINRKHLRIVQLLSPPCMLAVPWVLSAAALRQHVAAEIVTVSHHQDCISNLNALPGLVSPYTVALSVEGRPEVSSSVRAWAQQTAEHPTSSGGSNLASALAYICWCCSPPAAAPPAGLPSLWEVFGNYLNQLYPNLTTASPAPVHDALLVAGILVDLARQKSIEQGTTWFATSIQRLQQTWQHGTESGWPAASPTTT